MRSASIGLALALGGALLQSADGAPQRGADQQIVAAAGAMTAPGIVVALPARRMAVADPDHDGIVSRTEAAHYYEARFALIDRDRDGRLSAREFLRSTPSSHVLDATWELPLDFDAIDLDGNGALTPEDLHSANGWHRGWPNGTGDGEQRVAIFEALDGGRDGALSRQEFTAVGLEDFAASDADGDGQVTVGEFYAGKRL